MNGERQPVVYVVDDDPAVSQSLRFLLGSVKLKTRVFAGVRNFLDAYDARLPGCLLLDIRMPGMSGIEVLDRLEEFGVALPVIVLTGHGDVPLAVHAMKSGAVDFLRKPVPPQQLLDTVQLALRADAENRRARAAADEIARRLGALSAREREVLERVARGGINKQIAAELGISPRTVESHRANGMKKLGARNLVELIGLVAPRSVRTA